MNFFKNLIYFGALLLFISCSSNAAESAENTDSAGVTKEIQILDSLTNDLDKTTEEIEASTKALEDAVKELDDLN